MQAPILLDALIKEIEDLKNVKGKAALIDKIKHLYEVTHREAYASGQERFEDDDEL